MTPIRERLYRPWMVPRIGCPDHSLPYPYECWWCADAELRGWDGDPIHAAERDPTTLPVFAPDHRPPEPLPPLERPTLRLLTNTKETRTA